MRIIKALVRRSAGEDQQVEPELGTIDLVLLTNPRTVQRPAVRALISTVLASGSRSLAVARAEETTVRSE